jgi:Holliday junction resolvase YEN1
MYHQRDMQAGLSPPLQTIFGFVCRLLTLPVTPVFVFDGGYKPLDKRSQRVEDMPHDFVPVFQELLECAGFHSYKAWCSLSSPIPSSHQHVQAPGEAEAELAELSARGLIDVVMTNDSDALLFGATHVMLM